MRARKFLLSAVAASVCGLTVSAAIAGPLMLGPISPSIMPKVMAIPIIKLNVPSQALATYRQVRTFWLSRAIVR